jgi:hypothetical protein
LWHFFPFPSASDHLESAYFAPPELENQSISPEHTSAHYVTSCCSRNWKGHSEDTRLPIHEMKVASQSDCIRKGFLWIIGLGIWWIKIPSSKYSNLRYAEWCSDLSEHHLHVFQIVTFRRQGDVTEWRFDETIAFSLESEDNFYCSIPASLQVFYRDSSDGFPSTTLLSSVIFESRSRLVRIETQSLFARRSLKSLCIPSPDNVLCESCFSLCSRFEFFAFDPGSNLSQIRISAFWECSSRKSICVHRGI